MLRARPLRRGDTVGLVGVSGPIRDPEVNFERMLEAIDAMGYRVRVADNCRERCGYLAGTDEARARGLNQMFRDDRVDAVVCMRGGYGVTRMLDRVDFDAIRANPKIFLGFSDITALHAAIHQRTGLVTFHGPMPATCWVHFDDFTRDSMVRALTSTAPLGPLVNPEGMAPRCYAPGRCEGPLVGGCLSLLAATCGTPYALDVTDKVLLLEDVGEYIYRLDSMLTQLRHAGVFDRCAGVVLGGFTKCGPQDPNAAFELDDVVRDVILPAGKPVLGNLAIGHLDTKLTVPLGARCAMDAGAGTLEIVESALEEP